MSTKSTIAHGPNFHFYHELGDDDHVYLRLEMTEFEAGYGRVMVPIPIHIWETIRPLGGARFDLIEQTDEDLFAIVERDVDERIAEYKEAFNKDQKLAVIISLSSSMPYGGADEPRDEQLKNGIEYYREERKRQREVHEAILKLRESQGRNQQVLLNLNERWIASDLLILLMERLSQEHFSVKWSDKIETQLWEAAIGQTDLLKREGEQARYLSEKCRGWAIWDKTAGKPRYLTLNEWEAHYYKEVTKKIKENLGQ
jgi:hypothetical protein